MKKRKMLAVLMAAVMTIASIPGLAVQADSIGKEAQACKELGILIGSDSSGVTEQYLETTPTRVQAYIISLRLRGLYQEAGQYTSSNNFKDAGTAGWAENYLAYAKSKPELGWGGYPDGTFAPSQKINGQAFYKVMLETLGYKQDVDFSYSETLDFAEELDLVKDADDITKLKSFTVNDIAEGIYNALNTKPKDSDKKLISVMVEKNIITSDKAVTAGFTLDTKDAKVIGFRAVSNSMIELEFDNEIVLQKGDVEISQLGSSSRLSVLNVESQGRSARITTTEAKPFNAYEVAVNTLVPTNNMVIKGYKNKFVAMPKDSTKPTAKHELLGRNEILVTFSEEIDRKSAESLSNYMIEHNVVILNAELGTSGTTVLLKTTDISSNSFYRLNIRNVADVSGNKMSDYTALFEGARSDTQGPSLESAKSENNTTLAVTFSERVDSATAEDIRNYSIGNNTIVIDAELDDSGRKVTLTTSVQSTGVNKLTVQNVADTWGNVMNKKEYNFVGDTTRATATILAISNNEVMVTFNKTVDKETAEDADNYSIDKNLEVKDAILGATGKTVMLITSSQTLREVYALTISGVTDLWGNEIDTGTGKFGGMPVNNKALDYTVQSNSSGLIITYNKRVDKETAENVFNYHLDSQLGYAAKAALDEADGRTVTLLTAGLTSGKVYTITIEDVKDISGIRISKDEKISTKKFAGINMRELESGSGELTIETVVTVDMNTIDLVFSGELTQDDLEDMEVDVDVPEDYSHTLPSNLTYYKFFVGDKKSIRVQFRTSNAPNPELFKAGNIYEVEITDLDRLQSKDDANVKLFAGTGNPNEAPYILEVKALNNAAVEIIFSEPVKGITRTQFEFDEKITISGVSVASDEITDKVMLYISNSTKLDDDEYKLYIKTGIKDAAGLNALKIGTSSSTSYVEFDGNDEENENPYIDSDITVIDSHTMQFEFNEPIKPITTSSFSVKKVSGTSSSNLAISKAILADDEKTVTLYLNAKYPGLDADDEYELVIGGSVKDLQDLAVNSEDRILEVEGVDNEPEALEIIAAYVGLDNKKVTLLANKDLLINYLGPDDFKLSGAGYYKSSTDAVKYDSRSITILLSNELDDNEELLVEITSAGRGKIKDYNFQDLSTTEIEVETN